MLDDVGEGAAVNGLHLGVCWKDGMYGLLPSIELGRGGVTDVVLLSLPYFCGKDEMLYKPASIELGLGGVAVIGVDDILPYECVYIWLAAAAAA